MRLTELKALDKLVKSDKRYDFLQHVFVSGHFVYACTPYIVFEVFCKELENNIDFHFRPIDMAKAEQLNNDQRFVPLIDAISDETGYWDKWQHDYFSKYFEMEIVHNSSYDPKYLIKILQTIKAFKCNVSFMFYTNNKLMTYESYNSNYEIKALLMPLR